MPVERHAPDLIVKNGRVRTLDGRDSIAEAVAVRGDRIVGVGSGSEIEPLADGRTEVLDARGRTVLPGFIDGHTHFNSASTVYTYLIDFLHGDPKSLSDVFNAVRQRSFKLPPGSWIRGDGLNEYHFADEQRLPTRWELDEVAPDHPVVLFSTGYHMASANSLALKLAGISRETEDPLGGKLDRDEQGELTGVLRERAKLRLDPARGDAVVPTFGMAERLEALKTGFDLLLQHGVTSIHDIVPDPEEVRAYHLLQRAGELGLRVQLLIRGIETQTDLEHVVALGLQQGLGDDWLKIGGIKMSVDGVCICRNAAVHDPYPGEPDNLGIVRIPQEELDEKVALCHRNGLRVAIHAIGQRAVDMALQSIEKALQEQPLNDHRHRIEHAYLPPRPGQLERMARLRIVASPQPSFIYGFGDGWISVWGEDNLPHVMPLRTMLDLGLRVMGSTDFACVPVDPFLTLRSAVARRTKAGVVLDPREAISLDEALRLQTTGAAFGGFDEGRKGSLEVGKLADLIVISEDPYEVPPDELNRIQVDATVLGGRLVYQREAALAMS
jgi:predicted amidohydrolase YtcJ